MQIYPNRFDTHLEKGLSPFYMVFGEEPLQKMLTIEQIRKFAFKQGFDERQHLSVDQQFSWNALVEATQSLSLFSDKQFIELELPTGKPGAEGSKILKEIADATNPDTLIVIHGGKIGKDVQNSKWFKALDKNGVYIPCYPLEGQQLQNWIGNYMRQIGINSSPSGAKLISEFCEGNLLAAKQEVDKLLLSFPDGQVSDQQIEKAIVDQSRFNVFQLIDVLLSGDPLKTVKLLYRLEAEGVEPTIIIWALTREWQTLSHLKQLQGSGKSINWNQFRIWKNRQSLYQSALTRLDQKSLLAISNKLQLADQRFKQSAVVRPYIELCHLCMLFIPCDLSAITMHD